MKKQKTKSPFERIEDFSEEIRIKEKQWKKKDKEKGRVKSKFDRLSYK